ncbi:MAG: hypoxanthine phosphoribosyltransferase [Chloroflexi bacterium]|nr:hypoxanthine phosphoribosyltransferase [Chloroflexota bacterium]
MSQVSKEQPETEAAPHRPRRRRRRTPASATATAEPSADEVTAPAEVPQPSEQQPETEAAPPRPRRRRRRTPASATATVEPSADGTTTPTPAEVPQASEEQPEAETAPPGPRRRRGKVTAATEAAEPAAEGKESRYEELAEMAELPSPRKRRAEAAELAAPEGTEGKSTSGLFAHPAEEEFSHLLNFYGVKWLYEPRSFPLRWEGNRTVEMFTPDFYLPEEDLFVELTTLKQSLVTEKNRKLRHLRELYPDINIKLLYRRDIHRLLAKYGYGPLADEEVQGIERVLFTKPQIERRVAELGRQISADYEGEEPVLVGVLRGVACFMSDLMRQITLPLSIDFMAISTFDGSDGSGVRITKDLDIDLKGRHVLMVEDIVDTGMTLNYLLHDFTSRGTASLKVCTLLDKQVRRLADFKLDYVGFEAPDEFMVGYGLDYLEKYRNLPFIGILKPGEQPATSAGRGRRRPRKPASTA